MLKACFMGNIVVLLALGPMADLVVFMMQASATYERESIIYRIAASTEVCHQPSSTCLRASSRGESKLNTSGHSLVASV